MAGVCKIVIYLYDIIQFYCLRICLFDLLNGQKFHNFISSAGASSPAVPMNVGSIDGSSHGQVSKAASLSCVGSQPPWTSLSTSAGGSSRSCRPWERGDLLRRLATFIPINWLGKPQV